MRILTLTLIFAALLTIGSKGQPSVEHIDVVLPGRHLSEHQAVEIASQELDTKSTLQCEFRNGVWEILEVQKKVWGVSSATTNAAGKIMIVSTNATKLVLRVRDADGKVEHIKNP